MRFDGIPPRCFPGYACPGDSGFGMSAFAGFQSGAGFFSEAGKNQGMDTSTERTVADVGEQGLIAAIHRLQPPVPAGTLVGIGDDAAVLALNRDDKLLVSTDMLVESIHFRRDWSDAEQVGEKAVAVNVSDIAGMGGVPYALLSSIAVAPTLTMDWVERFYRGFARAADVYGAVLIGGDTVGSPGPIVVNVTILGFAKKPILRRGACPGDRVLVTGRLGAAQAGLELLQRGWRWPGRRAPERAVLAQHMRPIAQVAAGQILSSQAHALTDISDGLASELQELVQFGGVGIRVDAKRVPIDNPTHQVAADLGQDALDWALFGGEDYELLAAVPPSGVREMMAAFASQNLVLTDIGEVTDRPGMWIVRGGQEVPLHVRRFNHFGVEDQGPRP